MSWSYNRTLWSCTRTLCLVWLSIYLFMKNIYTGFYTKYTNTWTIIWLFQITLDTPNGKLIVLDIKNGKRRLIEENQDYGNTKLHFMKTFYF